VLVLSAPPSKAEWAYYSFNDLGEVGEIAHPQKNTPRAIILGLPTVGGLYLLANVVYFRALPSVLWRG
jgi:amino acid transporter